MFIPTSQTAALCGIMAAWLFASALAENFDGDPNTCFERSINGRACSSTDTKCMETYPPECLFSRIPPAWQVSYSQVKCCLRCCVSFWMKTSRLSSNERFWLQHAQSRSAFMFAEPFTDWRFKESLVPHGSGEVLLGHMSFALISDINVFPSRNFVKTAMLKVVETPGIRQLAPSVRPLVAFTGSGSCVKPLMSWLMKWYVAYNLTVLSRDDAVIGRRQLSTWRSIQNKQRVGSASRSKWYIMNPDIQGGHDDIRSIPLGIKFPLGYMNGMKAVEQQEGSHDKHNKGFKSRPRLITCSSMRFSYADRVAMRDALEKNGFNCHEGMEYTSSLTNKGFVSPKRLKALGRQSQDGYVRLLRSSHFFVSPLGNGRDCYRHLEGTVAGSILVSRVLPPQDMDKFRGIPAVFVKSWNDVTHTFLMHALHEIYNRTSEYDLARAYFPFWLGRFLFPDLYFERYE